MDAPPRGVLFVHAHPDDETISTGGTIATLVDDGVPVTVITCTRGEQGEVIPEELRFLEGRGRELADHREGELARAMRILGVTDHRYLGADGARQPGLPPRRYLDSGMMWGLAGAKALPEIDPESLCAAPLAEVAADIATVIAEVAPAAVVSYDQNGGYGHPDHIRAHEAAARAAQVMGVPFFMVQAPDAPVDADSIPVDAAAVVGRKADAMRAHRTQITVTDDRFALSSGPAMPIATHEYFRRLTGTSGATVTESAQQVQAPSARFAEWSVGSRVIACIAAALSGVILAFLGTINHQSGIAVLGWPIPLGVVGALVMVAALVIGLRLVTGTRALAAILSIALAGALWFLAQPGPGGSVLIPGNPVGVTWAFGAPLVAALVLAWPNLRRG